MVIIYHGGEQLKCNYIEIIGDTLWVDNIWEIPMEDVYSIINK